ncbi:MAG: hypothetical protein KBC84_00310 [Proteobacteria bacterium]|nr:hypothetical protein [Pseudomonadota bacterium]
MSSESKEKIYWLCDYKESEYGSLNRSTYLAKCFLSSKFVPIIIDFKKLETLTQESPNVVVNFEDCLAFSDDILRLNNFTLWVHDLYHRGAAENSVKQFLSLAKKAKQVIFSSYRNLQEAKKILHSEKIELPLFFLPYPVRQVVKVKKQQNLRKKIIFHATTLVEDRAHVILNTLREFKDFTIEWLINEEEILEAKKMLREFEINTVKLILGRTPEMWEALAATADIALHLRVSAFGDIGEFVNISFSQGIECVVSDFADTSYLSENIVSKILPGVEEQVKLKNLLTQFAAKERSPKGSVVLAYAEENLSLEYITSELLTIL